MSPERVRSLYGRVRVEPQERDRERRETLTEVGLYVQVMSEGSSVKGLWEKSYS